MPQHVGMQGERHEGRNVRVPQPGECGAGHISAIGGWDNIPAQVRCIKQDGSELVRDRNDSVRGLCFEIIYRVLLIVQKGHSAPDGQRAALNVRPLQSKRFFLTKPAVQTECAEYAGAWFYDYIHQNMQAWASTLIKMMTIAADCVFYFLPFFIAWSAAKRFKTDTALALMCAGFMLYPTMTAGLAEGASPMSLFGLPIPFVKYASSSIPIILTVLVLKYVYQFFDKIIPQMLKLVFVPMFTALVMCPIALGVTGPIANYISKGMHLLLFSKGNIH